MREGAVAMQHNNNSNNHSAEDERTFATRALSCQHRRTSGRPSPYSTDDQSWQQQLPVTGTDATRRPSARQRRSSGAMQQPLITTITPRDEDVLCGKEKHCIIHPGTRTYRRYIDAFQPRYQAAANKHEKMECTKEIVETIGRTGARFLRYNKDCNTYEELSHLEARDKTSHALRTACKRINKHNHKKATIPTSFMSAAAAVRPPATVSSAPIIGAGIASATAAAHAPNTTTTATPPHQWQQQQQSSSNHHARYNHHQPQQPVPRFQGRVTVDHHHPLPIHSEEKMDGALFDDLLTLLKDPEPVIEESE